ncbi:MAG: 2-succinyl-5-enolpyruvyl-6-hydroxy-3-cyclohexene-1-carboxylic-acid synthase [Actinomycetota bacterium]|nr:2-succinyl-5-enolpyruvyl-6-hydroxy-3-cyclohexene-1-carboxylic-acid synthase [Actinomycetota bacterium]MDH4353560.1 2-succinyl-5-enolpyruvyl-6-hydroxy-3-cyclohexene-1-carboxylic-acid synthase [Actinomycetota bacterium]
MNPSTALATVLVDELLRCGLREAVLAPGSRSAPLALALQEADVAGRLRLHVRLDERSAGYLALGLAKASGVPVPVVTTSGTAAANLHPAVLEADQSGVPLLLLTADRPPELRSTGANQTIDQVKLFGDAVRMFAEVGAPDRVAGQTAYWRALTGRTWAAARGTLTGDPGPVHLNLAFRDPLVPDGDPAWPEPLGGRPDGAPWTHAEAAMALAPNVHLPARTLVVVGDTDPVTGRAAGRLAEEHGWPVVSEPSGNARSGPNAISTGALLLGVEGFVAAARPEQVLVVGRPTLSRPVMALLRDARVVVSVVATTPRWADATRTACQVLPALPAADGHHDPDAEWLALWQEAERAARAAVDELLASPAAGSELRLARDLAAGLPSDALLYLGSSMPIRDHFLAAAPREGVTVMANRGAAGIDGTVSSAMGAALAWQRDGGGRAFAVLGDLTALHDANGLVRGPDEPTPDLTCVVVNNDGGAIFGLLEQGAGGPQEGFERVFGTPHGVDLAAWCGATQTPHTRAGSVAEAVEAALDPRGGLQVVELRTDRTAVAPAHRALQAAAARAVTA